MWSSSVKSFVVNPPSPTEYVVWVVHVTLPLPLFIKISPALPLAGICLNPASVLWVIVSLEALYLSTFIPVGVGTSPPVSPIIWTAVSVPPAESKNIHGFAVDVPELVPSDKSVIFISYVVSGGTWKVLSALRNFPPSWVGSCGIAPDWRVEAAGKDVKLAPLTAGNAPLESNWTIWFALVPTSISRVPELLIFPSRAVLPSAPAFKPVPAWILVTVPVLGRSVSYTHLRAHET